MPIFLFLSFICSFSCLNLLCYYDEYWPFRVEGKSHINDFTLAAEACLPIINAILVEIKNKNYPQRCFLNVDLPTNVANNKVN